MNAEQEEELRQERVRLAEYVKARAHKYKVCADCSSAILRRIPICPFCHSYRWIEGPVGVIVAVDRAATYVFPATLGYAQRTYQIHWPALENNGR